MTRRLAAIAGLLLLALTVHQVMWAAPTFIPEGTMLRLGLKNRVVPDAVFEGDTVALEVVEPVLADDGRTVLIRAGERALAQVTGCGPVHASCKGKMMHLTLESTRAAEGTRVPLRATLARKNKRTLGKAAGLAVAVNPLFLLMRGRPAVIPAGTIFTAYVDRTVAIGLK